ncbi:MAG: porin, partial [Xanthobacteraceae bacterium]
LGSAAGLVAIAGAQAADLPVKAKAVEYVKVCSLYGAGFYYIPGTDTCVKIGDYIRSELNIYSTGSFNPGGMLAGTNALNTREGSPLNWRTRIYNTIDVRSQTAYGTLRGYARSAIQWSTNDSPTAGSGAVAYIDTAYLQFAGFTTGLTSSFYDLLSFPMFSNQTNIVGSDSGGTGIPVLGYTFAFGNGVSASLAIEDGQKRRRSVVDLSAGGVPFQVGIGAPTTDQTGNRAPDLTANIRVDQAWGSAQISGALHDVGGNFVGANSTLNPVPEDKIGWAAQAGLIFNLPTAKGDALYLQAAYAEGALGYVTGMGFGTAQWFSSNTSRGAGWVSDSVFGGILGTHQELTKGWSVVAAIQHYWQPNLRTSLYGTYLKVDYSDAANAAIGLTGAGFASGVSTNDADFSLWQIGSRTVWNPVPNLDVGLEAMYTRINTAYAGPATLVAVGSRPAVAGVVEDQGIWSGLVRFQRNFWP